MDRAAVFVDAGFLFAAGSELLCGLKLSRGGCRLDAANAVAAFKHLVATSIGRPVLRIYWYDGTSGGPSPQHQALWKQPDVKVRLGSVNTRGQQKGVDSLIVTDMIMLARNRAMSDAVLLAGDEDLRVGVVLAQELGVRVHLLGLALARHSQSVDLIQEADTHHLWTKADVAAFLSTKVPTAAAPSAPPIVIGPGGLSGVAITPPTLPVPGGAAIGSIAMEGALIAEAERQAAALSSSDLGVVAALAGPRAMPKELDRKLLIGGSRVTG